MSLTLVPSHFDKNFGSQVGRHRDETRLLQPRVPSGKILRLLLCCTRQALLPLTQNKVECQGKPEPGCSSKEVQTSFTRQQLLGKCCLRPSCISKRNHLAPGWGCRSYMRFDLGEHCSFFCCCTRLVFVVFFASCASLLLQKCQLYRQKKQEETILFIDQVPFCSLDPKCQQYSEFSDQALHSIALGCSACSTLCCFLLCNTMSALRFFASASHFVINLTPAVLTTNSQGRGGGHPKWMQLSQLALDEWLQNCMPERVT